MGEFDGGQHDDDTRDEQIRLLRAAVSTVAVVASTALDLLAGLEGDQDRGEPSNN